MIPTPWTALHENDDFGALISNTKYSATLAASTDTTLQVPTTARRYKAVITVERGSAVNVWMALNATSAVPAGASFATTSSELITNGDKICREVKGGDELHFITSGTDIDVSVVFYSV